MDKKFIELEKLDTNNGYIYVILNSDGFVKVGMSNNPYKRLNSLNRSSNNGGSKIVKYYVTTEIKMDTRLARLVEKCIHIKLNAYCKNGEYFDCSFDIAKEKLFDVITSDDFQKRINN